MMNDAVRVWHNWAKFWNLFIGLGAVGGALMMFIAPDGSILNMKDMLPCFQVLPFAKLLYNDFIFPGIALIIVNGLTNLITCYLNLRRTPNAPIFSTLCGLVLMLWIGIQFVIFEFNVLSTSYFVFGFLQFSMGLLYILRDRQTRFTKEQSAVCDRIIGSNAVVIYFSRHGYVKRISERIANGIFADLVELKTNEHTEGFCGFMWAGRFGVKRLPMEIEPLKVRIESYDQVIICTPVWVFGCSAPIRAFCKLYAGKLKRVAFVSVHTTCVRYERVFKEMATLLELESKPEFMISIAQRFGHIKRIWADGLSNKTIADWISHGATFQ